MMAAAKQGNLAAQKEVWRMLKRLEKVRKTYRDAFREEDSAALTGAGYEVRRRLLLLVVLQC